MKEVSAATLANLGTVLGLLGLHLAWSVGHVWPGGGPASLLLLGLPLAAVALLHVLRRRSASFWAGVLALVTFCHGVSEAWSLPGARIPALLEVALSVGTVLSSSWDGLVARFGRGRRRPPTV